MKAKQEEKKIEKKIVQLVDANGAHEASVMVSVRESLCFFRTFGATITMRHINNNIKQKRINARIKNTLKIENTTHSFA